MTDLDALISRTRSTTVQISTLKAIMYGCTAGAIALLAWMAAVQGIDNCKAVNAAYQEDR